MADFAHTLRVRFCEVDEYGFVWHGHYIAWFEVARVEMLREVGLTPRHLLEMGYLVPVVDLTLNCKRPVKSDARVTVLCTIEPAEKAMLTFHYRLVDSASGDLYATGLTSHVIMNDREKMLYLLPDRIAGPLEKIVKKYPAAPSTPDGNERPTKQGLNATQRSDERGQK